MRCPATSRLWRDRLQLFKARDGAVVALAAPVLRLHRDPEDPFVILLSC
jgi:hypothetical protein